MELHARVQSSARKRKFELVEARATVGSGEAADIRLRGSNPARVDAIHAEIQFSNGRFILKDLGSRHGTFVHGDRITERDLVAGDVIDFGRGGYTLRFDPDKTHLLLEAPLRKMSRSKILSSKARILLDIAPRVRKPSRFFWYAALAAALVIAASVSIPLEKVTRENRSLRGEVERLKVNVSRTNRSAEALLAEAARARERLMEEHRLIAEQLGKTESRVSHAGGVPGEVLVHETASVGLITGVYGFVDPESSRPLRFAELDEAGEPRIGPDGQVLVSPVGKGPVLAEEYSGTGFVVGPTLVLTNRHLMRPWASEPRDRGLIAKGWKPRLYRLTISFPSRRHPISLELARVSRDVDLALCRVRGEESQALPPPLALAEESVPITLGDPVAALGFPAGEEGLLARLDPGVLKKLPRGKQSSEAILRKVAELGLVKPLATQGHIGDISEQQIVYDAATTFGGSGSPLLDAQGRVIGVAFAMFTPFSGSNFAIPARYARELLREEESKRN